MWTVFVSRCLFVDPHHLVYWIRIHRTRPIVNDTITKHILQGEIIAQVHARDGDELDHEIGYTLSGQGADVFVIDPDSGEIKIKRGSRLTAGLNFLLQAKVRETRQLRTYTDCG